MYKLALNKIMNIKVSKLDCEEKFDQQGLLEKEFECRELFLFNYILGQSNSYQVSNY